MISGFNEEFRVARSMHTVKQLPAAIPMPFDWLATGQVIPSNRSVSSRPQIYQ
jgi:hypothetical protein